MTLNCRCCHSLIKSTHTTRLLREARKLCNGSVRHPGTVLVTVHRYTYSNQSYLLSKFLPLISWKEVNREIPTYIIGHYCPSVRIINLAFHNTYIVCVNFIDKWRDLHFKVDSERQIFEKHFLAILFTLRVFAEEILFIFCSCLGLGLEPWLYD